MSFPFQFFLSLKHLIFDLLLVGGTFELIELLLSLDQFLLILLDEFLFLLLEMSLQFLIEFLDGLVEGCFGLLDSF